MPKPATIIPVILCGGSGTRLWPMSREQMPKQFLRLIGEETLLQATALRAMLVGGAAGDHIVTVTLESMQDEVKEQFDAINPALSTHILCEPMPRNTSAAVAFAARYVEKTFGPDALMWILAADHHMGDINRLKDALNGAIDGANRGYLVTFGIKPNRPETGYGYIKCAEAIDGENFLLVERFVEKPNRATAASFLEDGSYLWNSGMFLFRADTVLETYKQYANETLDIIDNAMTGALEPKTVDSDIYETSPEEPFDKAIMEKSDKVAVIHCDPKWSDIGSWESLWEISPKDDRGNSAMGRVCLEHSTGCFVRGKNLLIGCAGLENIVVIETGDAVLIANKSDGDSLKKLVTRLRNENAPEAFEKPRLSLVS